VTEPRRPSTAAADAAEKRRIREVFGDVLPVTTSDERDDADAPEAESAQDRWLRSQVPPHHG
jgi:hypothetical protein